MDPSRCCWLLGSDIEFTMTSISKIFGSLHLEFIKSFTALRMTGIEQGVQNGDTQAALAPAVYVRPASLDTLISFRSVGW